MRHWLHSLAHSHSVAGISKRLVCGEEGEVWVVERHVGQYVLGVEQQVTVQTLTRPRAEHFAGPQVEVIGALAMLAQPFELFLQPLPVSHAFGPGCVARFGVFLQVAVKDAGTDQKQGAVHGVQQGFGVVEGQAFLKQAVAQPVQE